MSELEQDTIVPQDSPTYAQQSEPTEMEIVLIPTKAIKPLAEEVRVKNPAFPTPLATRQ